jgi:hypothetical protein
MSTTVDYTAVIFRVNRRLKRLTPEQMAMRVGNSIPTIAEIILLMTKDVNESWETALEGPLNSEKLYYLGQLVVVLDIVAARDKRSMLIRWFD